MGLLMMMMQFQSQSEPTLWAGTCSMVSPVMFLLKNWTLHGSILTRSTILHFHDFFWLSIFWISLHHSGLCRNRKLPKRSQSRQSVILRPHVSLFTYSSNSHSLEFRSSPPLVKQTQSKWVSLESWKRGGSDGVNGVGVFGELGTLCHVDSHFHSFSISNYIVCHFSLSGLHPFSLLFLPLGRAKAYFHIVRFSRAFLGY